MSCSSLSVLSPRTAIAAHFDVCCQMDIVAAPTHTNPAETPGTRHPESLEKHAGLTSSDGLMLAEDAEHPTELNKPHLLKAVSVRANSINYAIC
jgi:hypothetical protein